MTTIISGESNPPIILSTGMYDLLKEQLRKRKLSKYNENKLSLELKSAIQVLKRELPHDVVTVDRSVRVKDLSSGEETSYRLVAPDKAKRKNNTISILSPIGVAMLGYRQGAMVRWEMPGGIREFRIEDVSNPEH
ncbi:GreA/GreB family elongation factor [Flavihumibacter sp. R14]|nr:GreA/GreB family elongation factor [Flavihumibacter soli]